jgi:hypothetical protein
VSGTAEPDRCSVLARTEPLVGTAPLARAWFVLEQDGPYGARALEESHLPEPLRAAFAAVGPVPGTTVLLARRVGHHADSGEPRTSRRFWVAHSSPGGVRMRSGELDDALLLRSDLHDILAAAARGELPPWGTRTTEPLLLVCTNGRRDLCCAVRGRPVAESLAASHPGHVLEVSHLGGHRFSPTALLLPTGDVFGRLDPASAADLLDSALAGRLGALDHHRGRTSLAAPAQVAEHTVRRALGIAELDALDALRRVEGRAVPASLRWDGLNGVADVEVRHRDGRAWQVEVHRADLGLARPESCGKEALDVATWVASEPVDVTAWS